MTSTSKTILVTGGCGYIGSHTVIELIKTGYNVVIVDNLSNSDSKVLEKIKQITGIYPHFYAMDIADSDGLAQIFKRYSIIAVVHFAAFKSVSQSVEYPLMYYKNNVGGSIALLELMQEYAVKTIIFSSSATVYGGSSSAIKEDFVLSPANPYGYTKFMVEQILRDIHKARRGWRVALLRYFNPVGAHESRLIGENPSGIPNNLMPYIAQVALGKLDRLQIYGNDYPTHDGTGVRDYIHVVDVALAHVQSLQYFISSQENKQSLITVNLGTGIGYSVLDVVKTFEQVTRRKINYIFAPRRSGDVAVCYADVSLARTILKWCSKFNLKEMCSSYWDWQKNNLDGYQ